MQYNINIHKHNFAVWSAATAARASSKCRFKVSQGKAILEKTGFTAKFTLKNIPSVEKFDEAHRTWRNKVINESKKLNLNFSHGVAAKIINCYLKVRFVCSENVGSKKINCIHPPIDSLLLKELARIKFGQNNGKDWRMFNRLRWSKFNSKQYESVIAAIKNELKEKPLWLIEQHWPIHV
jgi:hypothetical protein